MNVADKTRELIEIGRHEVVLGEHRLEQNRARILARALAVGVVGASALAATSAGATAGAGAGAAAKTLVGMSLAKWAVAVAVVGGSVGGTYALATHTPEPEPVVPRYTPTSAARPAPQKQVASRPTAHGPVALVEEPIPSSPARPQPAAVPGKPRPAASAVSGHAELLRDARTALAGGDAGRALALLDGHPEVGRGPLGPEWSAARVLVLCRLGRVSEAQQLAQRFLKSHPHSPLASQVAGSCAGR